MADAGAAASRRPHLIAQVFHSLASAEVATGDAKAAAAHFRECLRIQLEIGERFRMADVLQGLAETEVALGQFERAACTCGVEERLREQSGRVLIRDDARRHQATVAQIAAAMDGADLAANWARGRAMEIDDIVAFVLDEGPLYRPAQAGSLEKGKS